MNISYAIIILNMSRGGSLEAKAFRRDHFKIIISYRTDMISHGNITDLKSLVLSWY